MATTTTSVATEHMVYIDDVAIMTGQTTQVSPPEMGEDPDDIFFTETLWYNILLLLINLLAIFLNGMIIFIVARYREMRSTVTLCFVNLAITDIALTLAQTTGSLRRTTGIDLKDIFGCSVLYYLHQVTLFATGLTMTFLAFDRYRLISHPLQSIKNRKGVKIMLSFVAIWLLSFAVYFYIPLIHVNVGTHCTNIYINVDQAVGSKLFHTSKAFMHYVIPIILSGFFYGRIYVIIKRAMVEGHSSTVIVGKGDQSLRSRRLRGIRTAALVLCLYAVCNLPGTVLSLWRSWDPNFPQEKFYVYHLATGLFAKINTVVSPFLYALSANSFQAKLRRIFCCPLYDNNSADSKARYTSKEQLEQSNNPSFKGLE